MIRSVLGWCASAHVSMSSAVVALLAAAALAGAQDPAPKDDVARRLQVLFVGAPTRNGPHHDPITRYRALKKGLGVDGIDLTYTEDPASVFTDDGLQPFDAVLLYGNWDQNGMLPKAQSKALLDYVDRGGAFVPVHCASACWGRSPEFVRLVGGRFARHGTAEFEVENVAPDHPALAGSPSFRAFDETYEHDEHGTDRTVLQLRENEPWTWVRTQGEGRVFYTAAGHDHRVWDQAAFQQLLRNGILWAVGEQKRELLRRLELPVLEQEQVSLPGYRARKEITMAQKPLSPGESQKLVQVPVSMQVSLFASEPDIVNPIHIAFDHRGRAFVVETVDYPNNLQAGDLGHDRITICEDQDGDGRADRFTRFCEGLSIPTSLAFCNGGVVCTNGKDVLFLADTDGDDRADVRKVLFSGIGTGDTHAGVSNLRWAQDGFLWATVGYSGFDGEVAGVRVSFSQGVFRFRPDGSDIEFVQSTTNNTWGLGFTSAFDKVGSTANGNPSFYLTFADAAYRRVSLEPHVTPRADTDPLFFPSSMDIRQVDFFDRFTSAAGHAVYTAARFPSDYRERAAFVCEPTGKLVATFQLQRRGGGFAAEQSPNNLFSSADAWTSPVCAEVGPDGAVWICDWYNLIVQHNPTPSKGSAGIDARTGRGNAYETPLRDTRHGRIWRVFPRASKNDPTPNLAAGDAAANLTALGHDNLLWRLHAQRLLVERGDLAIAPRLEQLVREPGNAAAHALHALAQLQVLTDETVAFALRSSDERLLRAGLALANVAVLKTAFVTDGPLPLAGRELAELLVRLSESAADPEIGSAILRTGIANEAAIFDDVTLRDAWRIAAQRHAETVLAAAKAEGVDFAARPQLVNVLPNPDFAAALGDRPAGWQDLRIYGGAGADRVTAERRSGGRDGSPCLYIAAKDAPSDCGVAAVVPVKSGRRYRLSGFVRTEDVKPVRGSDGAMLNVHGGVRTRGVSGTTDWTELQVEFDAEQDDEIVVHCLFGGYGGARGAAWFDDVALVEIGSGNTLAGALQALATSVGAAGAAQPAVERVRTHPIDPVVHARGAAVYSRTCIACHGDGGKGLAPAFPPLDGSDWLTGKDDRAIDIVLHGLMGPITVNGVDYQNVMPPLSPSLSDAEIADVLTHARQRWSNDASPISPEKVAARRAANKDRAVMWTVKELGN
ncbi:MAG: PVC-type heme-binding CxxCH protein [Planctomycetota bacterium]